MMSQQYNKTKSGANAAQLQDEINADPGIGPVCEGIKYADPDLVIQFDSALSGAEETTLDGLISAHTPAAPPSKVYRDQRFYNAERAATMNSTTRTFLGGTGAMFLAFGGGNPDDHEAAWTIQVPSNYKGDPKFYLKFCTATTASDVQFEMDLAKVPDGESFNTIDESLAAQAKTGSATDWYQVTMGAFAPTISLSPNQTLIVHIHRDASDAPDTYTGSAYVALLVFDYEAV